MYGTPPAFLDSAEEKWALLDKDIEMEDSETENENGNGRTNLHHSISLQRARHSQVRSIENHDIYIIVRTYVTFAL